MKINLLNNYSFRACVACSIIFLFTSCAGQKTTNIKKKGGVAHLIEDHLKKSDEFQQAEGNLSQNIDDLKDNPETEVELTPDTEDEAQLLTQQDDESQGEKSNASDQEEEQTEYKAQAISIVENPEVNKWIHYFTVRDRERFQRMLNRGEPLREVVQNIFAENGLPKELYYLGLIESGYVTTARSHANAVGAWQFIKGTGKRYGLLINNYVDERHDPIRATEAAARYLRGLFNVFQSWELVMAAYNCGEYRVLGSVMRNNERDYWKLMQKNQLPKETRDYVPKFMAASIIGLDPEKYGFKVEIEAGQDYPDLELVEVASPMPLQRISSVSGVSMSVLQRFNPHLKKLMTPPGRNRYEVWLPKESVKNNSGILAGLQPIKGKFHVETEREEAQTQNVAAAAPQFHRVRRGESLSTIARKYNQSVSHLLSINKMGSTNIRMGQRLRLVAREYHATQNRSHTVRNGENLTMIARRYGTTVPRIKSLNKLGRNSIHPGQELLVSGALAKNVSVSNDEKENKYKVRRGDTLQSIAKRFGTSVTTLKKSNGLKRGRIMVGQVLRY